ncbi:TPA: hypothetical protein ACGW5B_002874 [Bacillus paranthracis]|uniref:Group-specific protein n=1 Tax=Bacillus pretiosus TaxID=2983392 RepID=A0ABT3EXK8_9BACI|nr:MULTISPECIES: hypothetical protein [Bacillus]MDA1585804.1 hypothetical protein [Bacillus cereus group sp. TH230-1LC]PEB07824.1 hypothetical protein COM56_06595 [Bacillus cereus]MBG9905444.1 hypothetical protein [Bacillus paranthracis]MCW1241321.1 hypothetical protein [Bacillus pretiosus]MDA1572587.1 hypothetical protein [Bacillus cereus group sp. TH242-3LC]
MAIVITMGLIVLGVIFICLSIYKLIKKIKEQATKKDKWNIVWANILELFNDPLYGPPVYFLLGGISLIIGFLLLFVGIGWVEG